MYAYARCTDSMFWYMTATKMKYIFFEFKYKFNLNKTIE